MGSAEACEPKRSKTDRPQGSDDAELGFSAKKVRTLCNSPRHLPAAWTGDPHSTNRSLSARRRTNPKAIHETCRSPRGFFGRAGGFDPAAGGIIQTRGGLVELGGGSNCVRGGFVRPLGRLIHAGGGFVRAIGGPNRMRGGFVGLHGESRRALGGFVRQRGAFNECAACPFGRAADWTERPAGLVSPAADWSQHLAESCRRSAD